MISRVAAIENFTHVDFKSQHYRIVGVRCMHISYVVRIQRSLELLFRKEQYEAFLTTHAVQVP